jgi:hypothetical protein
VETVIEAKAANDSANKKGSPHGLPFLFDSGRWSQAKIEVTGLPLSVTVKGRLLGE